jgi:hypothetical protein
VGAGLIFALAVLTKQSALIIAVGACAYAIVFNIRQAPWLGLGFIGTLGILYGALWLNSAGWSNYYLFNLPAAHAFDFSAGRVASVLIGQFGPVPAFLLLGLAPWVLGLRRAWGDPDYRYAAAMAAGLMVTGVIGRLNAFSGANVYVPSYVALGLLAGLGFQRLRAAADEQALPGWGMPLSCILLAAQFAWLLPGYFSVRTIPTAQDRLAGDALVARIRAEPGDVLLPDNNYLALAAGKTPYYNQMAMSEISGQGNLHAMPEWQALQPQIEALFHAPTTSAIIVDFAGTYRPLLAECKQQPLPYADKMTFVPVAGPPMSRPSLAFTCR